MYFKLILSLVLVFKFSSGSILDVPTDTRWAQAINAKLCQPGSHSDEISSKFFACYDEKSTPGGNQFIACQQGVYGVLMDTEAHIDTVCNASSDRFPMYVACLITRLSLHGIYPSDAIHKLNQCQGVVMGVPSP